MKKKNQESYIKKHQIDKTFLLFFFIHFKTILDEYFLCSFLLSLLICLLLLFGNHGSLYKLGLQFIAIY